MRKAILSLGAVASMVGLSACKVKEDKDDSPSGGGGRTVVTYNEEFEFRGATVAMEAGSMSILEYSMTTDALQDVAWTISISESTCSLTSDDVYVGLEKAENDYEEFPSSIDAGAHNIAFIVSTEAPCTFVGKARLAPSAPLVSDGGGDGNTNGGSGDGATDGASGDGATDGDSDGTTDGGSDGTTDGAGDSGDPDPATLPAIAFNTWQDYEWTTEDWADGSFGHFEDFKLVLASETSTWTQSSSWSSDCAFADFDGPWVLIKDGDEWTSLPDSLGAGTHVIRLLLTATKACHVNFSIKISP